MSEHAPDKSRAEEVQEPILGSRSGWLCGIDADGSPLVDFKGNTAGPVAAQLAAALDSRTLRSAATLRQGVVLLFENGDPHRPFLMGLIQQPSPTPCSMRCSRASLPRHAGQSRPGSTANE